MPMEEVYKEEKEGANEGYDVDFPTTVRTYTCLESAPTQFWDKCLVATKYVKEDDVMPIQASMESESAQKIERKCKKKATTEEKQEKAQNVSRPKIWAGELEESGSFVLIWAGQPSFLQHYEFCDFGRFQSPYLRLLGLFQNIWS
ncbi:hypothetical protein ACH5RR_008709 [Cinchona calisaya]|uniref:Uncharacterized protein n=1 Tax=Cinchona calisaya TaxID=153742 RepID=A0ABD3AF41_9GENT